MSSDLSCFLGIHAGEKAWVFGKGPSLSSLNPDDIDGITCCINDTVQIIPNPDYGFSNDGFVDWQDLFPKGFTIFQPKRTTKLHHSIQRNDVDLVSYTDHPNKHTFDFSPEKMAKEGLTQREGTLGSIVQILYIMGIRTIVAVGIDGGNNHCSNWKWRTQLQNEHFKHYNRFKHGFIADCQHFGIEILNPDGSQFNKIMKIRILSACSAGGNSFSPYDIKTPEVSADIAADLVGAGRAEYVTKVPEDDKTDGDDEFASSFPKLVEALGITKAEFNALKDVLGAPEKDDDLGHNVNSWKEFISTQK
jgi:hypothetical protein